MSLYLGGMSLFVNRHDKKAGQSMSRKGQNMSQAKKERPWFEGPPTMFELEFHLGGILTCPTVFTKGDLANEIDTDSTAESIIDLFREYIEKGGKIHDRSIKRSRKRKAT